MAHPALSLRIVSIEPSRRCSKACAFCYNGSGPTGDGEWTVDELVGFARDLAANGVEAISFGGGEPLEWPGLFDTLEALRGTMLRSLTTNGLPLEDPALVDRLVDAGPDKVHLSIHQPSSRAEVRRVIHQVGLLERRGLRTGVNLLVDASKLAAAARAATMLRGLGIDNGRIVYLPRRGSHTPSPEQVARVAGGPFQSMSCLSECGPSERFASIGADRTVAWCSYTRTRRRLDALTWAALVDALDDLGLEECSDERLVRIDLNRSSDGQAVRRAP